MEKRTKIMYKWVIDKEFHFEMGHRVWAQKLEHEHLSLSTECACKHLHGHSYAIKVFLGADNLDNSSMVTDFKNLNFMKQFVDDVLDHKFMIDINDPNFSLITGSDLTADDIAFTKKNSYSTIFNLGGYSPVANENILLHRNSFVVVTFVPTSENICKFLFEYAQEKLGDIAKVTAVELWETRKSHCRYEG
jgi:6-pyruvoyltetrahydropterin/6-carboxytetrahydropterin synthase